MTGTLWAISAGVGFGLFQTVNRQAVRGLDVYLSTFMQLLVSALLLILISFLTQDVTAAFETHAVTWLYFSLAGFFHFLIGWTFVNASQKRIGAARTGSLIGATPLFAAVVAALTLAEIPSWLTVIGILIIVGGVYLVNSARQAATDGNHPPEIGLRSLWQGLAAAVCWSISPIFIRLGLQELDSPILGVTIGITASSMVYGIILLVRRLNGQLGRNAFTTDAATLKLLAAVLVGLSTWFRWLALDLAPIATVLALSLVSVPIVNLLAPIVSGRNLERVTAQVWLGSASIISGSLVLISV